MTNEQIYQKCKENPREMFYILTKDNFKNAKAIWGEKGLDVMNPKHWADIHFKWQIKLQQMVLEEKPLKYLEQFIK